MTDYVTDTSIPVTVRWIALMGEVEKVAKLGHYQDNYASYDFRGIDDVVNAVGPAQRQHGVIITPHLVSVEYSEFERKSGGKARSCAVRVRYVARGPAGDEFVIAEVPGESLDSGDKGTAKAMSVAWRIALLQALSIPTGDTDPDAERIEISGAKTSKARTKNDPRWFDKTVAEIEAATTKEQLQALWRQINEAVTSGQATAAQGGNLKKRVTKQTEARGLGAPPVAQRKTAQAPAEGWPAVAKPVSEVPA
jgi:hypothetical protein